MRGIDRKLFDAVEQGNLDRVQRCLNEGADVLARNNHHTLLHAAVSSNKEEIIKLVSPFGDCLALRRRTSYNSRVCDVMGIMHTLSTI